MVTIHIQSLPAGIVQRLANHLPITNQRAMRPLDSRFGELAATDWAVPLLHRVSRLMEHLENRRNHRRTVTSITLTHTVDGEELGYFVINCRNIDDGVILPNRQFSMLARGLTSSRYYIEENGDRDRVLSVLDQHVHQIRGVWEIKLDVDCDGAPTITTATYCPPLYQRQVRRHEADLPPLV